MNLKHFLFSLIFFSLISAKILLSQNDTNFYPADTALSINDLKNEDEQLAIQFYQNKDFNKALILFKKLFDKNKNAYYYNYLLNTLLELKDFNTAEKLIKKRIKDEPADSRYKVDLGYLYQVTGDQAKATKEFDNIIGNLNCQSDNVYLLANNFLYRRITDYAIKAYLYCRKTLKRDNIYNLELSYIYESTGNYAEMLDEYLNLLAVSPYYKETIQARLLFLLNKDNSPEITALVKKTLLKKIQQFPDNNLYYDFLLFVYIQLRDFSAALIQAKALDRTFKESGERIFNLALVLAENDELDLAADAYNFIINKGNNSPYFVASSFEILNVSFRKITSSSDYSKKDLINIETKYIQTLNQFGLLKESYSLIKALTTLQAFYMDKFKESTDLINKYINSGLLNPEQTAELKTQLADILLLSGDNWEASLIYSQVEKSMKNNPIGYEAKLKNAKLFYYIGEFEWAQNQLDVLKASTSKLIANDAMELYLTINDNLDNNDSVNSRKALLKFAKAEFLSFRNKDSLAIILLDSIINFYAGMAIIDKAIYKKALINIKQKKYSEAEKLLLLINEKYTLSIIADNALYELALLYENKINDIPKAMSAYEKIMLNFPASIYSTEARKRFRNLRGDKVN
ncbi:MAG: hypothetical protein KA792_06620 [Bacteroidales bacterium]|nr:hypothetical protein [Bacteroidales bacterium]